MQEISDPEQSLDRARENWQRLGRSEKWIQQRMIGQETRNYIRKFPAFFKREKENCEIIMSKRIHIIK